MGWMVEEHQKERSNEIKTKPTGSTRKSKRKERARRRQYAVQEERGRRIRGEQEESLETKRENGEKLTWARRTEARQRLEKIQRRGRGGDGKR